MSADDIGIIGCGVMGQNLARNFERHGYPVALYDTDAPKLAAFIGQQADGTRLHAATDLADLAARLSQPRRILMMVPAGRAVDECITALQAHLAPGDILIDGGNSHFADTQRRVEAAEAAGLLYVGAGISGGEGHGTQGR